VPVDFEKDGLREKLEEAGCPPCLKSLFIIEGVTQYISKKSFLDTLKTISSYTEGSRVLFTYALEDILGNLSDHPEHARMVRQFGLFGFDRLNAYTKAELAAMLKGLGFIVIEDVGAEDYKRLYLGPAGSDMKVMPAERMIYAEVGRGSDG
jgi:O-methyltransferase involved in polyketide biosynthesis